MTTESRQSPVLYTDVHVFRDYCRPEFAAFSSYSNPKFALVSTSDLPRPLMSKLPPSRTLTNPANGASLAAVLTLVRGDALSKRRRQDFASALRTVAKALGRPLDALPAHPNLLRDRLQGFAPSMAGLKRKRWDNAMSLVRQALKHAGFIQVPCRARTPFAPQWTALFRLTRDKQARFGLSRFARYCTTGHRSRPGR